MSEPTEYNKASEKKEDKKDTAKSDKPEVVKVVTGEVTEKKKGFGHKFKSIFFGGDFRNAAEYTTAEVILPALRNMIADATKGAVDRVVYGDRQGRTRSRREDPGYGPRVSYNSPVQRANERAYLPDQPAHPYRQNKTEANDLVFTKREDGEAVLRQMFDILEAFDYVTLADLYGMVGLPSKYTDNNWGWIRLGDSNITQIRDGWILNLPPMTAL